MSSTVDAAGGRAPWHTRYQLRAVVEYRHTDSGTSGTANGTIGELVCECGHVVEVLQPGPWWNGVVERGKKIACPGCPIEAKPIAPGHCAYDWETDHGVEHCTTRAHWHTDEWSGPDGTDLCTTHYRHLQREGHLHHRAVALD